MRRAFILILLLLAGTGIVFGQYDYEDDDLKKKPKQPPKETKPTRPDDGKGFDPSKMWVGGMFNFSFGGGFYDGVTEYSNILYLDISPIVGYQLIENRLEIGTGFIYQFQRYDAYVPAYNFRYDNISSHTYGGRIFPRVYVFQGLFLQLEYLLWNGVVTEIQSTGTLRDARLTFHNVFAGGGYRFPVGNTAFFTIIGSVNLNTNLLYPRRQFFVNFGFGVGF